MSEKMQHGSTKGKDLCYPDVSSMEGRVLVVYSFYSDEDDEVFFLSFSEITPRVDWGKNRNSLDVVCWAPRLAASLLLQTVCLFVLHESSKQRKKGTFHTVLQQSRFTCLKFCIITIIFIVYIRSGDLSWSTWIFVRYCNMKVFLALCCTSNT